MVFPQVSKDPPPQKEKDAHAKRLHSQANIHQHVQHVQHTQQGQSVIVSPVVVSHYAQNMCTELQLGLAPPTSGGGGFFASGLFRTRQPSRPRAYSMLPLTNSTSQEEVFQDSGQKGQNSLNPKKHSNRSYKQRYYPLSQEDTLELLLLLNQAAIAHQARKANSAVPSVSRTPLLLQFTPFGPPLNSYHVTARWEGAPINSQSALLDADDGATVVTDTIKDDQEDKEPKSCPQQTVKYIKILTPHVILVSVLIGYLCLGAWILMLLETKTELLARSRKLVNLTNIMSNFTQESYEMIKNNHINPINETHWAAKFREWMVRVSETVEEKRPIREELDRPDELSNMHNKWTFPTALLYVLTVLTTCGYGEVSVDTDVGKVFSVVFALVGIPLMFITAADIGKFLSETLLKFVSFWNRSVRKMKQWISRARHGRRKSLQSTGGQNDGLDILGVDGAEEKLWFPIGAYVSCICLYCSIGSAMFINWQREWSFIHAFHFGFNLIVTVGLGDLVVKDYIFLSLIVAFVIVGLSVVTMCVDLASTHLKAYFTRIHYFGRAKRFLGMSEELKEIVALLGAMRRKKGGKVTWNDVRDFLDNELRDRPFEPHELLMKLRFIDETSSGMSTIRHNSFQSDFFRESEYIRRVAALRPEQPAYL